MRAFSVLILEFYFRKLKQIEKLKEESKLVFKFFQNWKRCYFSHVRDVIDYFHEIVKACMAKHLNDLAINRLYPLTEIDRSSDKLFSIVQEGF